MHIRNAQFVKGVIGTTDISEEKDTPTVAFVGRSNAGKSSVINSLVGRDGLARSSSTPGRTQQINYFRINDTFYFADLPGYGYAKMPEKQRIKMQKLVAWFLGSGDVRIDAAVVIADVNVGLKEIDFETIAFLQNAGCRVAVIANKADKSSRGAVLRQIALMKQSLPEGVEIFPYSSKTKAGKEAILEHIESIVGV